MKSLTPILLFIILPFSCAHAQTFCGSCGGVQAVELAGAAGGYVHEPPSSKK